MADNQSGKDRAVIYEKMAEEAEQFASKSKFSDTREQYLKLARDWRSLAEQAKRNRY